jgi:hypothetical protein
LEWNFTQLKEEDMTEIERLLAILPEGTRLPLVPGTDPALSLCQLDSTFLKPPLRAIKAPSGGKFPPILIISAPGAVGKTALAKFIAAEKKCHLWDLSQLILGDNTFVGSLAKSFGPKNLATLLGNLSSGTALFVLDAFDEAEVLSGWQRIESFLGELLTYVERSPRPCLILLARSETSTLISFALDDLITQRNSGEAKYAIYEIDYFNEAQSREFVRLQLDRIAANRNDERQPQHRRHVEPFERALTAVFSSLYNTLSIEQDSAWSSRAARSFMGYAPVLQAIASYLSDFDNFLEVEKQLALGGPMANGTNLVCSLMRQLLEREQEKVQAAIKRKNMPEAAQWQKWEILYKPSEQIRRALLYVTKDQAAAEVTGDSTLPQWLVRPYSEALRSLLPQHPFLHESQFSGPAFRDYVLARLLTEEQLADAVKAELDSPTYVPTPLFVQFYSDLSKGIAPGDHAGYLYESAVSRHGLDSQVRTIIVSPTSDESLSEGQHWFEVFEDGEIESDASPSLTSGIALNLAVSEDRPVVFSRRLRHAYINVQGRLVLGNSGNEFEISDSEIACSTLELRSNVLVARVHERGNRVAIEAAECIQIPAVVKVELKGQGALVISWPGGERYPWAMYYHHQIPSETKDAVGAMMALRRILTWFKKDKRADLARYKMLIDNVAVGHSEVRQQMLQYLLSQKIVVIDEPLYKLDLPKARQAGINWIDLRQVTVTESLGKFLEKFLKWAS